VLATACGVNKSETATFASLLGLREQRKNDETDFVPLAGSKPRLGENDIWLGDEASMMHPKLLGYIEQAADFWTKVIFIGDSAQLSPVKFGRVSPALLVTPRFELTKVMRYDGAVLVASTPSLKWPLIATGKTIPMPFSSSPGPMPRLPS
jgi:exodeoxyribonuclease-5